MHEIAMHNDHNIDDFSPPFNTGLQSDFKISKATTAQIDALTACLTSIHTAMDCILAIEPDNLICLPTVFYARTAYAFIALLKMFSAISSDKGLARVFSFADLKLEEYFESMIDHLRTTSRRSGGRTASRFSMVLNLLRNWFNNRKTEQSAGKPEVRNCKYNVLVRALTTNSENQHLLRAKLTRILSSTKRYHRKTSRRLPRQVQRQIRSPGLHLFPLPGPLQIISYHSNTNSSRTREMQLEMQR
jgi:hypothetical protein